MKKLMTLCVIHDNSRVLLGMKKRGFGQGRWNGFGGKVHEGESIEEAAKREISEEAGVSVLDIRKRGVFEFSFEGKEDFLEVHLFGATVFSGEPKESEEMKPQWFANSDIPYGQMWPDDKYWFPKFLEGKNLNGKFHFKDENNLLRYELKEL